MVVYSFDSMDIAVELANWKAFENRNNLNQNL